MHRVRIVAFNSFARGCISIVGIFKAGKTPGATLNNKNASV